MFLYKIQNTNNDVFISWCRKSAATFFFPRDLQEYFRYGDGFMDIFAPPRNFARCRLRE